MSDHKPDWKSRLTANGSWFTPGAAVDNPLSEAVSYPRSSPAGSLMRAWVDHMTKRSVVSVEKFLEESMDDPQRRGIEVVWTRDPDAYSISITYRLSADVPHGEVHEYPHGKDGYVDRCQS